MLDTPDPRSSNSANTSAGEMPSASRPFVHVDGSRIVAADGTPLLLRGVGLGNWLLPEGYMWGFGDNVASPRQIEALVQGLLGRSGSKNFWEQFRARFITEDDISRIAEEGFDHVRLPVNWRILMTDEGVWRDDPFACVDRLIDWCRDHGLTVLIDLHGAPGGQTGTNIDDSLGQPALFMDPRNIDLTVEIWTEIARRYCNEPTVLGYDLLNEPLPDQWQHTYDQSLVALYRRLTAAIRSVDPHHLIMYEGMHWATNWDIFTEVWDPNSVLQFHKYWSPADQPSIQRFLDVGHELGLPVYMGEGEKTPPEWLAAAFQLYEDNGIGWNFWPWKKIETLSSPCSVPAPEGWDRVLAFASGESGAPSRAEAERIFAQLLDAMEFDACDYRDDVVNALLRRAPVRFASYGFSFRGPGASYHAGAAASHQGVRADDHVVLRPWAESGVLDFSYPPADDAANTVVAELAPEQWIEFDVELAAGEWDVRVVTDATRRRITDDSGPMLTVAGAALTPRMAEPDSGLQSWSASVEQPETARVSVRVAAQSQPETVVWVEVARADS